MACGFGALFLLLIVYGNVWHVFGVIASLVLFILHLQCERLCYCINYMDVHVDVSMLSIAISFFMYLHFSLYVYSAMYLCMATVIVR